MKSKPAPGAPAPLTEQLKHEKKFIYHLPPGTRFNDVYMDALQIKQELKYDPRTIRNMRNAGLLSYTTFHKRIYYFRQEIAAILSKNAVMRQDKVA